MTKVFRDKDKQPVSWFHKNLVHSNQYCLYCSEFVGKGSAIESTKEHLIGRKFVPDGSFGDGTDFNFIFRACVQCNGDKAEIERHISSVTLINSPAREDSLINSIAERKASKDYHPNKKGVLVKDSSENLTVNVGKMMNVGIIAPPQVNIEYVRELARYHVQGLFSLITTKDATDPSKTILLNPKFFLIYKYYHYGDWGNLEVKEIANRTKDWPCFAHIDTANGFFKAIMKRKEASEDGWFWALEWNKSLRVIGAIYHPESIPKVFLNLPDITSVEMKLEGGGFLKLREDIPYDENNDYLFHRDNRLDDKS